MPSMTISFPEDLKDFIEEQGASPGYSGGGDFIRHVLREEKRRMERRRRTEERKQAFIALVRDGLESPDSGMTPEDLRRAAQARIDQICE